MSQNRSTKFSALAVLILLSFTSLAPAAFSIEVSGEYVEEEEFPYPGDDWGWSMIGTEYAHQIDEYGEDVRVAILDTGVDYNHPDLDDKMWSEIGYDFVNDNDDPMDDDGHGTHVAGIVSSVAPGAELMALKVVEEANGDWVDISRAVEYARENGADIISMSFGGEFDLFTSAFEYQMEQAYNLDDILHVAAAGNGDDNEKFYPAGYDSVISVSAVDSTKQKADYSNYGDWIEMAAPGGDSLDPVFSTLPDESYGDKIGTSMAAPFVAGVAALRRSLKPGESNDEVRNFIQETAIDLGEENYYGHGLVNAYRAAGGEVPTSVQELEVNSSDSMVKLSWEEPWSNGSSQLQGYRIYRGREKDELELVQEVESGQLSYEDTSVESDETYHYSITAFNDEGEGFKVELANATPGYELDDFLPEWALERRIPVVPTIIVVSGVLLFILFSVALYRRRRRSY